MATFTVSSSRGTKSVESNFSGEQALAVLADKCQSNNFAQSLLSQHKSRGLSTNQWNWVHVLAVETMQKEAAKEDTAVDIGQMTGVVALFDVAKTHLKFPKIRLQCGDQTGIKLSIAGQRARFPGSINVVTENKEFVGRIQRDGRYEGRQLPGLVELLKRFAAEPAKVASEYGRLTGSCCFCGIDLTDERSTAVGYGPICAKHYDMPWGEIEHVFVEPVQESQFSHQDVVEMRQWDEAKAVS
jgi:Family of unknown function (DUF6011)